MGWSGLGYFPISINLKVNLPESVGHVFIDYRGDGDFLKDKFFSEAGVRVTPFTLFPIPVRDEAVLDCEGGGWGEELPWSWA